MLQIQLSTATLVRYTEVTSVYSRMQYRAAPMNMASLKIALAFLSIFLLSYCGRGRLVSISDHPLHQLNGTDYLQWRTGSGFQLHTGDSLNASNFIHNLRDYSKIHPFYLSLTFRLLKCSGMLGLFSRVSLQIKAST
jgi:hypothetical protein